MTVLFRCRIKKPVLTKADRVTKRLGTSTAEMVRIFLTQMAATGKVPLNLDAGSDESVTLSWEKRAAVLESFYGKSKTW